METQAATPHPMPKYMRPHIFKLRNTYGLHYTFQTPRLSRFLFHFPRSMFPKQTISYLMYVTEDNPLVYLYVMCKEDNEYYFFFGLRSGISHYYLQMGMKNAQGTIFHGYKTVNDFDMKAGTYVLVQFEMKPPAPDDTNKKTRCKMICIKATGNAKTDVTVTHEDECRDSYEYVLDHVSYNKGYKFLEIHITEDKLPSAILSTELTFPPVSKDDAMGIYPGSVCIFNGTYIGPNDEITVTVRRTTGSDVEPTDLTDPRRVVKLGKPNRRGETITITVKVAATRVYFRMDYSTDLIIFDNREQTDLITFAFDKTFNVHNADIGSGLFLGS